MRAHFYKHSKSLKDGTYIFVAKQSLVETSHVNLEKDFIKILSRSKAFLLSPPQQTNSMFDSSTRDKM